MSAMGRFLSEVLPVRDLRSVSILFALEFEYLAAPRHLGEITVSEASADEIEKLEQILGKKLVASRVWALQGSRERSLVVAAALKVEEHHGNIFDSPFQEA